MVDQPRVPSWFEDHLPCAPLRAWLPTLLEGDCVWITGGVRPPPRLARLLAAVPPHGDVVRGTLVHTGALHVPPSPEVANACARGDVDVVIDLAWVSAAAGFWTLRPWRREPLRRDVADRVAWIVGLGLVDPQQWTCADPLAVIVTMGRRRAHA